MPLAHSIAFASSVNGLDRDHRAEDLVLDHLVGLLEAGDHGRLEEVAGQVGGDAAGDDLGVAGLALEEALDPLALAGRSSGPRVAPSAIVVAEERRPWLRRQAADQVVVDPAEASTRVAAVQSWPAL